MELPTRRPVFPLQMIKDVHAFLRSFKPEVTQDEYCAAADAEANECEKALELLTWESGYHKTSVAGGLREQRERYQRKTEAGHAQP